MTYCKLDPFNLGATQPITGPTPFTQSTWFADPNLKRLYSDRWNFGVQQQVKGCSIQNPYNIQADEGLAATDLPHIFSGAWVYTLPFGRG